MEPLSLDLFDFELPESLIAQEPARPRDASKLLVLPRFGGEPQHRAFRDLPHLLQPHDLLVVNQTRVMPARLRLRRPTGGRVELLLHRPIDGPRAAARVWEGLGRPGAALTVGKSMVAQGGEVLEVVARDGQKVQVRGDLPLWELMTRDGAWPLPPYIERDEGTEADDGHDYQSIFAREMGAVAAPTASLHFTDRVLADIAARGVDVQPVVLHVGPGTFLPIRPEHAADVRQHAMHGEHYEVPAVTQAAVAATRARGGRVLAVGTTCLRALETWAQSGAAVGNSELFVYPGFDFRLVDGLVTNFHLPRSTLLLLVSALAGRERVLAAYREAMLNHYRFYSYGDAMLIA